MAIWPFRRKGSHKRSPGRGRAQDAAFDAPPRAMTEPATNPDLDHASGSDRAKKKRQRESPSSKKLSRKPRTYSFSPGRRDSIRLAKTRQESVPPLPTGPIPVDIQQNHYGATRQGSSGAAANEVGIRDRTPTLHQSSSQQKKSAQSLPRKTSSSKRRRQDHDREAEIRALSQSHTMPPARPNADGSWTQGKPAKRNSKRHKTSSLMRKWHRPDSDISLPIAESLHSAMSEDSEHISYRVSAFDALAPRPTIRYASNPVFGAPSHPGPLRSQSVKRKLSERARVSEADLKTHKRIDNLADNLDASDLRELMERDKRRKERKQEKERERVERRLARRAERQRAEEAAARENGTPPPQNLERGVMGREAPAVEENTTSAVLTSSRRRSSPEGAAASDSPAKEASGEDQRAPSPLDEFHRENSFDAGADEIQHDTLPEQAPTAPQPAEQVSRSPSPGIIGFMRSRKRRSKSPLPSGSEQTDRRSESTRVVSKSESESLDRRLSESSANRPWLSRFRWSRRGGKARRTSDEPSSFSNTSRDSMPSAQQGSQTPSYGPIQRSNSKVPKRTMSRFREDLPELPLSPPDSRVASPSGEVQQSEPLAAITDDVAMRYDTPTSGHRGTPSPMMREDVEPSPAPHSMSMASIDSEGSWFGGRVNRKRASSGMRGSMTNYPLHSVSGDSVEHDEDGTTHDNDFLKIVTDEKGLHRKSTGEAIPSSDEEGEADLSPKWGNVTKTPTFTHHRETMRSREGLLLESFDDDEKELGSERGSGEVSSFGAESPVNLQHATSVKVGKNHGRNYSAGSAKLLDISPRVSSDNRRSMEPVTQ